MYRPADKLLWDFWTVERGGVTHLFHLQAPRDLPDPEARHDLAEVGHAVSHDLVEWRDRGVALTAGPAGAWDDMAVWTGSVADTGAGYAMLYTGRCRAEAGKVQRIGLATSPDLEHWQKHPANPVIEADPRWYLGANPANRDELAWRDPWLMRAPDGAGFVALITAQAAALDPAASSCVALARSPDLVRWTVGPPIAAPGRFFMMEIPQPWAHDGLFYLLFSAHGRWVVDGGAATPPIPAVGGTFYLVSDRFDGGYRYGGLIGGDAASGLYGFKLLPTVDGGAKVLNWRGYAADGTFAGALDDPYTVRIARDGALTLER